MVSTVAGGSPFPGKGVRLNSRGVWEVPRRTPCATPSWKEGERSVSGRCGLWFAALVALFVATPSFAEPTELDKKTVASKAYVDTKQDIINTSMLETWGYTLPSLVTYDSTDGGLTGTKFGVLRQSDLDSDGSHLRDCTGEAECEEMLPTSRAVADALHDLWEVMPSGWTALSWNVNNDNGANRTNAINAYNTKFGNGTNQWAGTVNSADLINGQFLANSLALKQNKIPAGTAGNVVTYSGTAGTVGSVATANAPTYNETTGVLENGTNIATIAAVDTRQKKMTCAGWDSETHTDEHCWLWSIE